MDKKDFSKNRLDTEKACGAPFNKFSREDDYSKYQTWVYHCYPNHVIIFQHHKSKVGNPETYSIIWLTMGDMKEMATATG